jgi:hypothetical protein
MKTETKTMPKVDITLADPRKANTELYALKTLTREEWLQAGINGLALMFAEIGETIPDVYVSVGYPKGARGKGKTIGQCHPAILSGDDKAHVFIHPCLTDSAQVLAVLAHEMIHALDNCESGHKGRFAKVAKAFGLEGKMTETTAGADLLERLNALIVMLGEYPHALLKESGKKQSTRMIKCECMDCGYIVRTSQKWIDELGAPICPCQMGIVEDGEQQTMEIG